MIGKLDPEVLRANQIKMNKRGKIIGIAMMAGALLITVVFGIFAYSSLQRYSWSKTDGVVTYASYKRDVNDEARSYYDYQYTVNGATYTGSDSENGLSVGVEQPPSEGATITVYYNPNKPEQSRVDTNKSDAISDFVVWGFCCGPIFFIFGAIFLFVSTRKVTI